MKKSFMAKMVIMMLAFTFVLGGCSFSFKKPTNGNLPTNGDKEKQDGQVSETLKESLAKQSKIKKFENYEEFATFLEENDVSQDAGYATLGRGIMMGESATDMAFSEVAPIAKSAPAGIGGGGSDDFSQTNIQVAGVDEADIIKTDGEYIYAVVKNSLYIVKAYPTENSEVLTKVEFKSRPQDIYINGDRLVIYGRDDSLYETSLYKDFRRRNQYTFFKVFDISDKKNPKQVRDLEFEGNYTNSRMIGDYVYFVTNIYNHFYLADEPVVPRLLENGKVLSNNCEASTRCFNPNIYYFDIPYNSYNLTVVSAINIKNNENVNSEIYTLSSGQNMYVSLKNLYITYSRYISEYQLVVEVMRDIIFPRLSAKNQEKISNIEKTEKYILSDQEKMNKIGMITERYLLSLNDEDQDKIEKEVEEAMKVKYKDISKELEKTIIHKVAINDGKLEYKTFGEVTGTVLNQFSMDEQGDYFRIATTKNRTWSYYSDALSEEERESYSNLYVLNSDLKVVGSVEELARGERIYSTRFMQDRAYMVTFKQTDPLFVIDLAEPTNPKVLGELKIPGFSNYLHPYGDDLLIGLGKDTKEDEKGRVTTKGLKLSLFNVADVTKPKEVDTYIMGDSGSDSIALYNHKAFLFSEDKNLLAIPATIREQSSRGWGKLSFSGAFVFNVDEEGFALKGKIDHSDGGKESPLDCYWGGCYYDNNVQRTLYIDNVLYTFSNKYLKMNKLDDLEFVKELELKKQREGEEDDFDIIN